MTKHTHCFACTPDNPVSRLCTEHNEQLKSALMKDASRLIKRLREQHGAAIEEFLDAGELKGLRWGVNEDLWDEDEFTEAIARALLDHGALIVKAGKYKDLGSAWVPGEEEARSVLDEDDLAAALIKTKKPYRDLIAGLKRALKGSPESKEEPSGRIASEICAFIRNKSEWMEDKSCFIDSHLSSDGTLPPAAIALAVYEYGVDVKVKERLEYICDAHNEMPDADLWRENLDLISDVWARNVTEGLYRAFDAGR